MIELLWDLPREAFWVAGFIGVLFIFGTFLAAAAILEVKRLFVRHFVKQMDAELLTFAERRAMREAIGDADPARIDVKVLERVREKLDL